MDEMDDEKFWRDQYTTAKGRDAAIVAFGCYAGTRLGNVKALTVALRKLVFAARTSGGVAGRDEYLCSACDEAEAVLSRK